ncbi:ammonia-forming cytochrome c nitrite reductase subunit c552 [Natranaerofaba carboxydovora]|uniref:ammonia-forming cytochrome c nitrite reductase subunit c552 n=1 Tax=Natranaerofaba carboxydovora TaxID=2742683 RepID=UPI001F13ACE5|nr:ammonia-forming cytochrome c nitrite reductase subunit c552 [Natranaerofaba carboxydovora]UMZ73767.1 Cytochrome c-552 [Natranaerofaba carboxydovora]
MKKVVFLVVLFSLALIFTFHAIGCDPGEVDEPDEVDKKEEKPDEGLAEEPKEFTGLDLEEAADPDAWNEFFPNQYATWEETSEMNEMGVDTTFGGASKDGELIDYTEVYPFLQTNYDGFGFAESYNRSRGHYYALEDVKETGRLPDWEDRPATCLACKSSDVVVGEEEHGGDFYDASFEEVVGDNTVSCLDCHSHEDGSVQAQRGYVDQAFEISEDQFKNIDPFDEDYENDQTCAQCHVNYYFEFDTDKEFVEAKGQPILPWSEGLAAEEQYEHYEKVGFDGEFEHARTGTPTIKAQHPEYELLHEGKESNVHSDMGLSCVDCHMPETESDDGETFSSHKWTSPLTDEDSIDDCLSCHSDWEDQDEVKEKTAEVQEGVYEKQNRIGEKLEEFIDKLADAKDDEELTGENLEEAQSIHREAQFYWDFIWVENSNGFHNWDEAYRVLNKADEMIDEGMEFLEDNIE